MWDVDIREHMALSFSFYLGDQRGLGLGNQLGRLDFQSQLNIILFTFLLEKVKPSIFLSELSSLSLPNFKRFFGTNFGIFTESSSMNFIIFSDRILRMEWFSFETEILVFSISSFEAKVTVFCFWSFRGLGNLAFSNFSTLGHLIWLIIETEPSKVLRLLSLFFIS